MIFRPDGIRHWIECTFIPIPYHGQPAVQMIVLDITDRKRAEETLREKEERFESLVRDMPVLVSALKEDGTLAFWNRQCKRVTGYSAQEMIGNPEAFALLYPDETYREHILQEWAQRSHDFTGWETTLTSKDGQAKTISWSDV